MKKQSIFLIIVVSSLLLFVVFNQVLGGNTVLDENSDGKEITANIGQTIELVLFENPSTGYSWRYITEPDKKIIMETGNNYESESNLIGAGGDKHWTYKIMGAGSTNLSLEYCRPWEKAAPIKTFNIKIKVISNEKE
jgi:predicted secreted protein